MQMNTVSRNCELFVCETPAIHYVRARAMIQCAWQRFVVPHTHVVHRLRSRQSRGIEELF